MSGKLKATDATEQAAQAGQEAAEKVTSVVKRCGEAATAALKQAAVAVSDAAEKGQTQVTDEAGEKVTSVVKRGGEAATVALRQAAVALSDVAENGQSHVTESMEKAMKTADEFVSFNQGNLEAMIKSGQILATGMQDLGKQVAATAQARFDEGLATFKALASVKSVMEAIDLQATFARSTMDKAMADTGKLTDASFKLAEQAIAPLTARVTLAVEKFSKTV